MYNQKIMEIFANPKNVGMIKGADGVGEAEDAVCGDIVKVYFKLENDVISEAKFKAFGGVLTIASAYALTEIVKNKTIEEAELIQNQEIVDYLEGVSEDKMYSIELAKSAFMNAIDEYKKTLEKELKKIENKK